MTEVLKAFGCTSRSRRYQHEISFPGVHPEPTFHISGDEQENLWPSILADNFSVPSLGAFYLLASWRCLTLPHASAFDETRRRPPQLSTSQGPIKSARTISEAIQGSIDLLLTDMPMTDEELQHVHETRGVRLLHIATGRYPRSCPATILPVLNNPSISLPTRSPQSSSGRLRSGTIRPSSP